MTLAVCIVFCLGLCVLVFLRYEKGAAHVRETTAIGAMIALFAASRALFAPVPFFKPAGAVVILTGLYFGASAGFVTGAAGALVSNVFFGQGPWTPFQMLAFGCIGLLCGLLGRRGTSAPVLLLLSVVSGVFYSLVLDLWVVLSAGFTLRAYALALLGSAPVTAIYVLSNAVFLTALKKPLGQTMLRLCRKYDLFAPRRIRKKF